ncbi:MOSC-domain-containing protein [Aureobasidium pullulans]|nr:MOSC-domain-containing protein [Aureobasidium pullulans]
MTYLSLEHIRMGQFNKDGTGSIELIPGIDIHTMAIGMITLVVGGVIFLYFYANFIFDEDAARALTARKPGPSTEVVSLRIYPIKSCRGIEVNDIKLHKTGLDLDRHWMFVDAKSRQFLTIRSDPSMTLIDTGLSGDGKGRWTELHVSIHDTDKHVKIPCYPTAEWLDENTKLTKVEIWGEDTDAWEYNDDINSIFSEYFKKPVALVYKGPTPRMARGNGSPDLYGKEQEHHFADVMSLQVASEASLADLNSRLEGAGHDQLTIERFRPNIIVKGTKAWDEDSWKKVCIRTTDHAREAIWKTHLDILCHCARCQVPNVNPDTAEKHAHEPWDTLMKFRRIDQGGVAKYKPCFGMLCIPTSEGPIAVGAALEVLERTENHLYNTSKFEDL